SCSHSDSFPTRRSSDLRLQADLGTVGDPVTISYGIQDAGQVAGLETTRRATPEVDRLDGTPGLGRSDLGDHGVDVPAGHIVAACHHGEVAIGADPGAEGDVHVDRGRRSEGVGLVRGHFSSSSTRRAATKASWGTSTDPTIFMRFFPSF